MASKRAATSDINHDNWDQEDEPEDAGTFQKASDDILTKRVIRSAKRRLGQAGDDSAKSAFGAFSGFKSASATGSSPFSFLSNKNSENTTASTTSTSIPNNVPTTNGSSKISENGLSTSATSNSLFSKDLTASQSVSSIKENASGKKPSEYYAKLKGLNQSVAQWIKTHVDANPVCILTPIFRDYEKYLRDIESKHGKEIDDSKPMQKASANLTESKPIAKPEQSEKPQGSFVFGSASAKTSTSGTSDSWKPEKSVFGSSTLSAQSSIFSSIDKSDKKSPFSATSTVIADKSPFSTSSSALSDKSPFMTKSPSTDNKQSETKSEEKPATGLVFPQTSLSTGTFSFGQNSTNSTISAGFSFGGGKPFSFGTGAVKSQEPEEKSSNTEEKEDEDEEPPKPDFKPVSEEGSIYEQKCKVFVKKDGNYSDRGVGTLFLKPAPNDKMQLIVRAVNSLGNLLLNTLLTESIPVKRLNKTNIMLVCLPLPTAEPPPVATLLRVKSEEEADKLFEALEKHKK